MLLCLLYGLGFSQTKMKTKWMPYIGIGQSHLIHEAEQRVWNYNHTFYDKFEALPVDEFEAYSLNSTELPVPTNFQYYIKFGLYRWLNQTGRLQLGFSMFNTNLHSPNLYKLAFSDMIDPERGFTMSSGYSIGEMKVVYNNLSFETAYFIEQKLDKVNAAHRFGLGLNLNVVLKSQFFIYSTPFVYPNTSEYVESMVAFYSDTDIGVKHKAMSLYPTFYYEYRAVESQRAELWLTGSYSDGLKLIPMKDRKSVKQSQNIRNSFIRIGLKCILNRS